MNLQAHWLSAPAAQLCQDLGVPSGRYCCVQAFGGKSTPEPEDGCAEMQKGSQGTWVEHHPEPITLIINCLISEEK